MEFPTQSSPYLPLSNDLNRLMVQVMLALIPGALCMIWFFGWGVLFNYSASINGDTLMPFIRGGYANDGGSLLERSVSVGLGYNAVGGRDQLGVAANWGRPNEDSFGPGLDDQYTFEVYYRLQITDQFALTPDIQYLVDPAQNPTEDSLWVFGLRARLAL